MRDWWAIVLIVVWMAGVALMVWSFRRVERSNLKTRQAVERYFREVDEARDDIADAKQLRQDVLDSLRPPTERSA